MTLQEALEEGKKLMEYYKSTGMTEQKAAYHAAGYVTDLMKDRDVIAEVLK